jgi:hypothetical protein
MVTARISLDDRSVASSLTVGERVRAWHGAVPPRFVPCWWARSGTGPDRVRVESRIARSVRAGAGRRSLSSGTELPTPLRPGLHTGAIRRR